jgi:hypothetical protein
LPKLFNACRWKYQPDPDRAITFSRHGTVVGPSETTKWKA